MQNKYNNNRKIANEISFTKLANILQLKNYHEEKLRFVFKNWRVPLLTYEEELRRNTELKKILKKLLQLKTSGNEEEYISELQQAKALRKLVERIVKENVPDS